ncbi:MAG: ATP-dependent DNA ligase, partial [Gammaproteobacteria bacterium]
MADIVRTSQQVAGTRGRLEKIDHLSACLKALGQEAELGVPYLIGEMRQGRIGMGWATIRKARSNDKPAEAQLTLAEVDRTFEQIAQTRGAGSAAFRTEILGGLFTRATADEQDFLIRLILGELRQGAMEGVMIEAIARAANIPPAVIRRAVMLAGDPTRVAVAALNQGAAGLAQFALRVMQPVKPMLADSADDPAEALLKLGEAVFEFKLDGARIQVHKSGSEVRVFTRRLNEVTAA